MTRTLVVCCGLMLALGFAAPALTSPDESVVFVGAGDIANCAIDGGAGAAATGNLLDRIPGTVFTVGDHAYPAGTAAQFHDCYEPRWVVTRRGRGPLQAITITGLRTPGPISTTSARTPGPAAAAITATRSAAGTSFRWTARSPQPGIRNRSNGCARTSRSIPLLVRWRIGTSRCSAQGLTERSRRIPGGWCRSGACCMSLAPM